MAVGILKSDVCLLVAVYFWSVALCPVCCIFSPFGILPHIYVLDELKMMCSIILIACHSDQVQSCPFGALGLAFSHTELFGPL